MTDSGTNPSLNSPNPAADAYIARQGREGNSYPLHEGKLTLDRRYFWIDAWAFEALAAEMESAREPAQAEKSAERLLALYRGPFMAGEADASWRIQPRERLRTRAVRSLAKASGYLEKLIEVDALAAQQASFKQTVSIP